MSQTQNGSGLVKFLATIQATQSGIVQGSGGDGMIIRLDIPESELPEAIKLWLMRGKVLEVTVREQPPGFFD